MTPSEDPRFPPLDFSLLGLAQWEGLKWVFHLDGEIGPPACGVRLAHADSERFVIVATALRERWDRVMAWGRPDTAIPAGVGEADFAFSLLVSVLDLARPLVMTDYEVPNEDRRRYQRGLVAFAEKESKNWESWEPVRWTLGGQALAARVFHFAHGWAGFSVDNPGYYVGVTAFNVATTAIDLAEVTGDAYNFDFTVPFGVQELQDQVGSTSDIESIIRATEVHPEHLRVMATKPDPQSLPIDQQSS